mmetsp:Transcript_147200/g.274179  ORF Transcript_147200/g.274179 Transcript_147200/m.274179 type:complete len:234 (+) Transcript_147200:55-756(+)
MAGEVRGVVLQDSCPSVDVAELKAQASQARAQLEIASKVPVPAHDDDDLLATPSKSEVADSAPANGDAAASAGEVKSAADTATTAVSEEDVRGVWATETGKATIFLDQMTNRLSYEEEIEGGRLHGWLVKQGAELLWHSSLWILEEDQQPWYGPSCGEEPERIGEIRVKLHAGPPLSLETQIRDEEQVEWEVPVIWSQEVKRSNSLFGGQMRASPGPEMASSGFIPQAEHLRR